MKKIICISLVLFSINAYADNSMNTLDHNKTMYFDFGVGVGSATGWNKNSVALNAMTMGFYMNKNWGVEIGMDDLPDGASDAGEAMIMTYHLAAKAMLPLNDSFSLYGKAGIGVNSYEGESPSVNMYMVNQVSGGLYYAAGTQFNINQNFSLYLEASGVAVPIIGNNGNSNVGSFGSTYQGTFGLEVRM